MDVYLISRTSKSETDAFMERVESRGSSFLGPQYETKVREVIRAGSVDTVFTYARNSHNPMPELYFEDGSNTYVFSGYLVDEVVDGGRVGRYFGRSHADSRPVVESPGGIYSYATVRKADGQICASHSTPTLEPVYFSEGQSALHVGNHPLFVHVAGNRFEKPQIDESFYLSGINAGVAIDDTTPFIGCYRLPPRTILVNHGASFATEIRPAPRPRIGKFRHSTYRQRRDSVRDAVIQSGSILQRLPKGEMRVSGGKDSRLVSAYLKHAGIEVTPVNQNFPQEVEGQVADKVARVLGATSCLRVPIEDVLDPNKIEQDTRRKIAYAGGLPPVAALQYPTRSEASVPGVPLIMGHAHLQRGGINQRIRSTSDALTAAASRTVSPYILPAYAEPNLRIVRRFVNETLGRGVYVQSVSFHAYLYFAMGYQFQSLYAYVRNWNPLITPLVDERFALLCADIADGNAPLRPNEYAGITDLRSERIAMGVTEALAPSLLEFPLADDRYRCDGPTWANYELREPDLIKPKPIPPEDLQRVFNTRRISTAIRRHMWEHIEGTVVSSFGKLTCRPAIWNYVSEPDSSAPADENVTMLNQFVWSLYGLSVILGSDWWQELAVES